MLYTVERNLDKLSDKNKIIARRIINKPSEIIWLSIKELADELSVSQASISRFSQHFGFSGFAELKIVLSQQLMKQDGGKFHEFGSEGLKNDIVGNLLRQNINSLQDTAAMLSTGKLMSAAGLIHRAGKIMCVGIGASDLVAQDITHKLLRIQKEALLYSDNDLRKIALTQFTKDDLLIAISYSGKKRETLELASMAHLHSVPIIAITGTGVSPLSQHATIALEVSAYEDDFRASALSSRISCLYVVDALFFTFALCFNDSPMEKLQTTYDTVNLR